jgi:hypothetical protein
MEAMDNKLIIQHENLPLRGYTKEKLEGEMNKFGLWITELLGLTGEESAKRILIALPAVEKHFWSLGFKEIEKAFTMYADGELITQPMPNYFTRILVGQIFKEYKQQKPVIKKPKPMPEISEEEKANLIYHGLITCYDYYIQNRQIVNGKIWVHDHLEELNLFDFTPVEKKIMWDAALENCKTDAKENNNPLMVKSLLLDLENKSSNARINEYKRLRMFRLFNILEAKNKHLKDVL